MIEHDPDADLLPRIGRGDQSAIREMVARKLPRLLALAVRMLNDRAEAEDITQETFMRIWKQAPRWQTGKAKFDTWMHRVALNLCYDRLRTRQDHGEDDMPEQIDATKTPEQYLTGLQQRDQVAEALAALPIRQREALVLQYYQEISNAEAAGLMEISIDALESLLSRARRNMRTTLLLRGFERKTHDT
ncbi:MAG: RNA polymerase sigma factor [Pseudomonadota bacterium]